MAYLVIASSTSRGSVPLREADEDGQGGGQAEFQQQTVVSRVRGAMRRRQMQAARARMMADVPGADVVVRPDPLRRPPALRQRRPCAGRRRQGPGPHRRPDSARSRPSTTCRSSPTRRSPAPCTRRRDQPARSPRRCSARSRSCWPSSTAPPDAARRRPPDDFAAGLTAGAFAPIRTLSR